MSWERDFGPFDGRAWINASAEAPMPRAAVEAGHRAMDWKVAPHRIPDDQFQAVPRRLRAALARLVNGEPEEIILGNSTTYGVHLLANGLPLRSGDEVLLTEGDFPASILPWLGLTQRGVLVRRLAPRGPVISPEEVEAAISPATRVLCTSWVNSFNGHAIDPAAIGAICRARGVVFALNGSQAIGTRPIDVKALPVDALVSCGFKWLCGPYATGFCWMRPEVLAKLEYNQAYWFAHQGTRPLNEMRDYRLDPELGACRYDVFCTANFNNFVPWIESVEYLVNAGIERIQRHNLGLIDHLAASLDSHRYRLVSPLTGMERATLAFVSHTDRSRNEELFAALVAAGIDLSLREGLLRFSPHLYNTPADIERAASVLNLANV